MTRGPRTVAQFITDARASKAAQRHYRNEARRLTELADLLTGVGDKKRAGECRLFAFIAANAARAEFFDPEVR